MILTIEQAENFTHGVLALHASHKYVEYGFKVNSKGPEQDAKPEIALTASWKIGKNENQKTIVGKDIVSASLIQRCPSLDRLAEEIVEVIGQCHAQLVAHHCTNFDKILRHHDKTSNKLQDD